MTVTLSLLVTKTAAGLSRLLGRGGGQALPGLIAERLDPHLIGKLAKGLPNGVILVTGTNGKTTTTKLISTMLEAGGEKVLTNSTGSNLRRGVTSALIGASSLTGKIDATVGLFEVDEASLRQVSPEVNPRFIVVLNLFRDQLDRYGELDTTAALIGQGIAATTAELVLNADDPLVASLAKYASTEERVHFFGVETVPMKMVGATKTVADSDRCPICHRRLEFDQVFYGHIGHWSCPEGHFERPKPEVALTKVEEFGINGTRFDLAAGDAVANVKFPLPGLYNVYNALAAIGLARAWGIDLDDATATLALTEPAFGRVEAVKWEGRTLYLLLIKNPAGFTQVLETFLMGRSNAKVLMAVNDLDADGRDVSWLWDVPLESLAGTDPYILCSGIRATDMALRLHYAGFTSEADEDLESSLTRLVASSERGEDLFVLPTYTAMLQIRKVLSRKTQMKEAGK